MTTPRDRPFLDSDNPLLAGGPAVLHKGIIGLPAGAGNVGVATIRTPSTTVTLVMSANDLDDWGRAFHDLAAQVREAPVLALPNAGETITFGNGNARPPVA